MATRVYRGAYGQGGGYGQTGPGLNSNSAGPSSGDSTPYRVPPSPEGGGYHAGAYEAEHYREPSEREPGSRPDQYNYRWDDRPLNTGHRGKGPRNYTRADERIEEDVNEHLTQDGRLDATDIRVAVAGGEITLEGSVDSRDAKHRAEYIAEAVSGVRNVQNNLRVQTGNVNYTPPSALEGASRPSTASGDTAARPSEEHRSDRGID
jgi:hypothetical protein